MVIGGERGRDARAARLAAPYPLLEGAAFRERARASKLAGMRLSAGKWADIVAAWDSSGSSARAFAEQRGIAEASLRWWKSELARRARNEPARRSPGPRPRGTELVASARGGTESVALARVVREGETPPDERSEPLVVIVGRARVLVQRNFDPALLRAVVDALGSAT